MTFLVVGDVNADLAATLARFPHEGDDSPIGALGWGSGGAAGNVATALAILGARVRLFARVGVDPAASVALAAAARAGVDRTAVQRDPQVPTGLCFAAVSPGGERTFFSFRGANVALAPADPADLLRDVGWVHLGGHALLEGRQRQTALEVVAEASGRAIPVSIDLCLPLLRADREGTLALLPRFAAVFANALELEALSGGSALGAPLLVTKLGARGSAIPSRAILAPAFPVEARDSTGAGDAYVAGFLFAHRRGAPLEIAARIGNALGALTATRAGAADALPSLGEVRAFLEERAARAELRWLAADPPHDNEAAT